MKLKEVRDILQAEVIWGEDHMEEEVTFAGGSDLMSDVLAFGLPGILMLTGLTNSQSIRTADIVEAKAVVYVRGKKPDADSIALARSKNLPILATRFMMYTACGRLFNSRLPGVAASGENGEGESG
jgi:predicted transcriptional regulator